MTEWEVVRHQVAIAGRVSDAQTGKSIGRARVAITAAPAAFTDWLAIYSKQYGARWATMLQRPDRTLTASDGHFHWLDLPDGQYTLVASLPDLGTRYGTAQVITDVSRDAQDNINMAVADIALPPTTVEGRITVQGTEPPENVVMAEVRIKGSGEQAFSDAQGHYRLRSVETGERTLLISARGYQPAAQTIQLNQPGEQKTLDFTLIPSTT